ncbi:MAG: hypothetical protein ACOX47_04185 [Bacillota bacterium]
MKKSMCLLLVVVFMMSLVTVAWADTDISEKDYVKVEQQVDKANDKIKDLIEKADIKADKKNADINKIIDKLRCHTDKIAQKTIDFADKYGVEVICEYELVEIGGQYVLIDPLRIRRY